MLRSNTDFPVPEPPTTPRISSRRTVQFQVVVHGLTAKPVNQAVDGNDVFVLFRASETNSRVDDGENCVGHDDQEN